jgi:ABC-type maltose transport system permease subunit
VISAGVILVIIPTLVVFLALQRFIYNGYTTGAAK